MIILNVRTILNIRINNFSKLKHIANAKAGKHFFIKLSGLHSQTVTLMPTYFHFSPQKKKTGLSFIVFPKVTQLVSVRNGTPLDPSDVKSAYILNCCSQAFSGLKSLWRIFFQKEQLRKSRESGLCRNCESCQGKELLKRTTGIESSS